ncbi:MAG: glycosyltransferase family 4 protein [Candidatus Levybacteria bacterium]|nr:glycosyltransferase family 4 protein [Candidatus Levybacteria bacterium]
MNILLVSSYLPYPLFSGGHIRLYNLIKELSKKHKLTLICEKRDYQGDAEISELKKFCKKVITVKRKKQWSIKNILKTGLSFLPFLITGHTSPEMKKEINRELIESQFDLIHVETSYVMQNLPGGKVGIPIVLVEHNVEYLAYKRFVDKAPLPLRPLLYLDILKLKHWEEATWARATKLIAVSEIERKIMNKIRKDVAVVSNGADINKFKVRGKKLGVRSSEIRILFIGEFKWMQNRDAIEWIIKEIWPKLKEEFIPPMNGHGVKLWVVGRSIPESIRKLTSDKNIIFDEQAPKETEQIYQKADLLLAPIRVGGGTSFKILEAMASGVPVVTTSLGNAVGAKEDLEIVVAESTQDFVIKIKKLLEDKAFYETISNNARKLIEEKFNWQKIAKDLNSVYESVIPYV